MANPFFSITSRMSPPATNPSIGILTVADSNLSHTFQHAVSTTSLTTLDDRGMTLGVMSADGRRDQARCDSVDGIASEASDRPLLFGPII